MGSELPPFWLDPGRIDKLWQASREFFNSSRETRTQSLEQVAELLNPESTSPEDQRDQGERLAEFCIDTEAGAKRIKDENTLFKLLNSSMAFFIQARNLRLINRSLAKITYNAYDNIAQGFRDFMIPILGRGEAVRIHEEIGQMIMNFGGYAQLRLKKTATPITASNIKAEINKMFVEIYQAFGLHRDRLDTRNGIEFGFDTVSN